MIVTTTTAIDGRTATEYVGVVTGEAVLGANVFRDVFAGLRDIVGGRAAGYERSLRQVRETARGQMIAEAEQLGADAVIGLNVITNPSRSGKATCCWSTPQAPQGQL